MERFRQLLDYTNDAMFIFKYPSGAIVDCNTQARRYVDREMATECNVNFDDLVSKETWIKIQQQLAAFDSTKPKPQSIESHITQSGKIIPVEITVGMAEVEETSYAVAVARL